jgi:hypothetical protein
VQTEHKGLVECGTCGLETYELLGKHFQKQNFQATLIIGNSLIYTVPSCCNTRTLSDDNRVLKYKTFIYVWLLYCCKTEAVRHEREISNAKWREVKNGFRRKRNECKPVLLRLSLAGNLEKPLMSLYGTEWRECGFLDSGL